MKGLYCLFRKPKREIQENPEALRKRALHLPFDFERYTARFQNLLLEAKSLQFHLLPHKQW